MSDAVYELKPPPSAGIFDRNRRAFRLPIASSVSSGGRTTARDWYQAGIRKVRPYMTTAAARPIAT
jgi:hypothetical protein